MRWVTVDDVLAARHPVFPDEPPAPLPAAYPPFAVPDYRTIAHDGWRVLQWPDPAAATPNIADEATTRAAPAPSLPP